jgi:hypothetical protein
LSLSRKKRMRTPVGKRRTPQKIRPLRKATRSEYAINTPRLEDLICGIAVEDSAYIDSDYVGLIKRLRLDLAELHPYVQVSLRANAAVPASAVFPFLARKFLELSLTALLARIDPIRVLSARKNQLHSSYEVGRQNSSSVAWSGDIFPNEKAPASNWDSGTLKKGVERSLLGWHVGEVAISHGLRWLADAENSDSIWLRELSGQEKPLSWIHGRLNQLYSTLSKGVHAEYLLDDGTAFDQETIQQHMRDCYMLVLLLATSTHRSPLFMRSVPHEAALAAFRKFEKEIFLTIEAS